MSRDQGPSISPAHVKKVLREERARYAEMNPRSKTAFELGSKAYLDRVPMHWLKDWPMPFPLVVDRASGAQIFDLDGHALNDFCLGDTGSMFGHSPPPIARALRRQSTRGLTYMLPSHEASEIGEGLSRLFGPKKWQIAATATDANRYAIRVARAITGRPKILVFNGCYHGTVDDVMVERVANQTVMRQGLLGQVADLSRWAVAIEFNDLPGLEKALAREDIAAVLAEPVMTNAGMILPQPGFLRGLRALTKRYGSLLILDETHTLSSGLGGYARQNRLSSDILVVGKAVGGGMPVAVWGVSSQVARQYRKHNQSRPIGHSGMGTTLSASPLQLACLKAALAEVMTEANYARMLAGAARLEQGLNDLIQGHALPWHVVRVGARVEVVTSPTRLLNGAEAKALPHSELEATLHLGLVNRGCLVAPFHNMMLVSPVTRNAQIDALVDAMDDMMGALVQKDSLPLSRY